MWKRYSLLLFWSVEFLKYFFSKQRNLVLLVFDLDYLRNYSTLLAGTPLSPSVTYSAVVTHLYSQAVVPRVLSMLFISQFHESE